MALTAGTIFQIQASATTGNINGAGFNIANANFPTDLKATSGTTSAPVVSSATYTFVSPGDVGNWVYVKSGTNWIVGWYQIASVSGGAATLTAGIGTAILSIGVTGVVTTNTTAGCVTGSYVAGTASGTFGVDYSQTDTANSTITNAVSVGSSTTLTSTSNPWTPVSVGNFFHLTTSGTGAFGLVGWYEIVSYNSAGSVVTDRTTNNGTALAAGTGQTGGAGRLNGLEDTFQSMLPASSIVWVKNGAYTLSGAISTANANATATTATFWIGYNSLRGDTCTGSNRPVITAAANVVLFGAFQNLYNLSFTTTAALGIQVTSSGCRIVNCKSINTSTTASRPALGTASAKLVVIGCEVISQNGVGIETSTAGSIYAFGNYIHDCVTGINNIGANGANVISGNLIEACTTAGITIPTGYVSNVITNNTIYGREAIIGTGLSLTKANSNDNIVENNIFYGLTTGISVTTGASSTNNGQNNDFFNNTTDVTNWVKDISDLAVNPTFAGASQLTGTTATTSGSVLTDSGASFGVTDNVDFLHVTSGTGVTVGCYLITSHTSTTLTVNNALGTSNAGNVVYWVTHGHNFQIGSPLNAAGFPSLINPTGSQTTSYIDVGAVQRPLATIGAAYA